MQVVESGQELMPHINNPLMIPCSKKAAKTPIRDISRNMGKVVHETLDVQDDQCGSDDGGGDIQIPAAKK